uniref:Uncharacterized protein MANES_09G092500 n=1 Tax=Rhizophora mucronata TaxID=61149 RepID=A0A2P2JGT2_RHIMU
MVDNACISRVHVGLELARGCLSPAGGGKQLVLSMHLLNFNFISLLYNPRIGWLCSSEASKEKRNSGGGAGNSQKVMKQFQNFVTLALFLAFLYLSIFFNHHGQKQVSVHAALEQLFFHFGIPYD